MNFLIGGDTYLWLYINFQNQINVGIRVLNSLNRQGKFFSQTWGIFFIHRNKEKKLNHWGNLLNLET